jgi:fructose-bisphosphate aldolase class 1
MIGECMSDGTPMVKLVSGAGIVSGIKADTGAKEMAGNPVRKSPKGWMGYASA